MTSQFNIDFLPGQTQKVFEELELNQYNKDGATVVYDIKGALQKDKVDARL